MPVLVNRGWVNEDKASASSRREGQPAGTVTIEGIARVPNARHWMQLDNEPQKNAWFWINLPEMAKHAGLDALTPIVVEAGPAANPGGWPLGGQTRVNIPNNHLQYIITWYSLALALLVIYVIYHCKRR